MKEIIFAVLKYFLILIVGTIESIKECIISVNLCVVYKKPVLSGIAIINLQCVLHVISLYHVLVVHVNSLLMREIRTYPVSNAGKLCVSFSVSSSMLL